MTTMAMMTLTLMTTLMMTLMITEVNAESILRTNYGYSLETLEAQVHFSTDTGRIVLTMSKTITAKKTPEQQSEENKAFNNPCSLENPDTHLDSFFRPRCRYILNIGKEIIALRRQTLYLAHVKQKKINALIVVITESPRRKRGLGSFLGSGLAWTFDLATGPNVKQLQSLLRHVLDTTNKALSAWIVGQNLITRVTKQTSNRFDQIDRLINLTRLSIVEENRRMRT